MASCRFVILVMIVFVAAQGLLSADSWTIDEPDGAKDVDMTVTCGGTGDSLIDKSLEAVIFCGGSPANHEPTSYIAMTNKWGPAGVAPSGFVVGNAECKLFNLGDDFVTGTPLKTKAFTFEDQM